MNYFEKCKIRIENAKVIEVKHSTTFSEMTKYIIDKDLVLRKFTHKELSVSYSISFRDVDVPISDGLKYLFELSEKKLAELDNVRNEEILRDL